MWGLFFHYIMVAKDHVTLGSIPLSWSSCATWCWVVPEIPWKWPSWAKASTRSLFSVYRVPILIPAIAKSYKRQNVINEKEPWKQKHTEKKRHFIVFFSRWYKKSHSLALTQSSAQYVPWTFPTLHVSSVGRANWNKTTSLAVKRLSSATVVLIKGPIE